MLFKAIVGMVQLSGIKVFCHMFKVVSTSFYLEFNYLLIIAFK